MGQTRKSAKDREHQGVRVAIGGFVLIVAGVIVSQPLLGIIGVPMVMLGLIMWTAGMVRRD